jgi:hypothetical protein
MNVATNFITCEALHYNAVQNFNRINNNSNNNNNNNKESEKILKYKDLIIEIQRMWKVKAKVTPVKIWGTGTISKLLR